MEEKKVLLIILGKFSGKLNTAIFFARIQYSQRNVKHCSSLGSFSLLSEIIMPKKKLTTFWKSNSLKHTHTLFSVLTSLETRTSGFLNPRVPQRNILRSLFREAHTSLLLCSFWGILYYSSQLNSCPEWTIVASI